MFTRLLSTAALALALGLAASGSAGAAPAEPDRDRAAQRETVGYIVVYRRSADGVAQETERRERRLGFDSELHFRHALEGFSAPLSRRDVDRLEADPEVAYVSPDRPVSAADTELAAGETVPTGVSRIGAATPTTVQEGSAANVAVLDSGIDLDHPDLNAASGTNCVTPGSPPEDDYGHGTHVTGSIAAQNDGAGVVGVAPGTATYAVKVLNQQGDGTIAQLICGIDWVTATHEDENPSNDIAVANMSLTAPYSAVQSCSTTTDALHRAICGSTQAGVTYVAAAGNSSWHFDHRTVPDVPAAYPEVLTVTAMSDGDGVGGGRGQSCSSGESDDAYASFSNFARTADGRSHTIAAPGTCIRSTTRGGGYGVLSGTSMAAPHVAGLVALCLSEGGGPGPCAGLSPPEIIQRMRSEAATAGAATPSFGFKGDPASPDPRGYFGYLAWGGAPGQAPADAPAPVVKDYRTSAYALTRGTVFSERGALSRLHADDGRQVEVDAAPAGSRHIAEIRPTASITAAERSSLDDLTVTFDGHLTGTRTTLSLRAFNFATGSWDAIAGPVKGVTADRHITWSPSASPASYISPSGQIRMSIKGSGTGPFRARTDLVRFTIEY